MVHRGESLVRVVGVHTKARGGLPFDTNKFVLELEKGGFSSKQAEGVLQALSRVLHDSTSSLQETFVSQDEFHRQTYRARMEYAKLRNELQTSDSTEGTAVIKEHQKLMANIEILRRKFREEVSKAQADGRLDLSLEKGRIRDVTCKQEMKLDEISAKINKEIIRFKSAIEQSKMQVAQYLMGIFLGTSAAIVAYIRLLM